MYIVIAQYLSNLIVIFLSTPKSFDKNVLYILYHYTFVADITANYVVVHDIWVQKTTTKNQTDNE